MQTDETPQDLTLEALPPPLEVSDVNAENFQEKVGDHYYPVVMRGLTSAWPIVETGKSSSRQVARQIAEFDAGKRGNLITVPASAAGRMFYNTAQDGMNFGQDSATLSQGLDLMLNREGNAESPNYCFQCVSVKEFLPGFERYLQLPLLGRSNEPHIWIGNEIIVAPHFDEVSNIAVVVAGRRRFTFFPPQQLVNLYIGRIDYTPAGQPISLVDLRNPDLERFPDYPQAYRNALSVELGPGDAVYIPPPWWHHVESLEDFNVLMNFWWTGFDVPSAMTFPMMVHAMIALKHLPPGQKQAWRSFLEHYVFEENGDPGEHLPEDAKGILGPMTPQVIQHMHQWLIRQLK